MNVRWLTTRAAFLLLAPAIYSGGTLPKLRDSTASPSLARLRFGQSIAFSDFDADGLVDEARLDGSGSHKSVAILLSGTGKLSFLHFDSSGVGHGSLLSQDVDDDGSPDLIWTDLLRADSVIVWLGDGSGEFDRLTACEYGGAFTLANTNIAAPASANQETAINCGSNRPSDQTVTEKGFSWTATQLPSQGSDRISVSTLALGQPTDRGPPALLS